MRSSSPATVDVVVYWSIACYNLHYDFTVSISDVPATAEVLCWCCDVV